MRTAHFSGKPEAISRTFGLYVLISINEKQNNCNFPSVLVSLSLSVAFFGSATTATVTEPIAAAVPEVGTSKLKRKNKLQLAMVVIAYLHCNALPLINLQFATELIANSNCNACKVHALPLIKLQFAMELIPIHLSASIYLPIYVSTYLFINLSMHVSTLWR